MFLLIPEMTIGFALVMGYMVGSYLIVIGGGIGGFISIFIGNPIAGIIKAVAVIPISMMVAPFVLIYSIYIVASYKHGYSNEE